MAAWKKTRDSARLNRTIDRLFDDAQKGDRFNLMPSIIEAVKAYATAGEVIGVIRLARGLEYDPFNMVNCPSRWRSAAALHPWRPSSRKGADYGLWNRNQSHSLDDRTRRSYDRR